MKKIILVLILLVASFLRLYKLSQVPPSLYWDEASLGYNAFSILKTARDEHGAFMPLTNFAAFGDYKPPGYIYATVPSIFLFGLTEFATRFPSAFFGILTVLLTYLLAKKLFKNEATAILAAFFLSISPWHLQFSRGAFEANLGLFFSTLGIYLFVKFATSSKYWLLLSALSFLIALYTFTGQRLFVPFILLVLALTFKNKVIKNLKLVVLTAIIFLILFRPLFIFATQTLEGRLRFNEVTIFKNLEPSDESIRYRTRDNNAWWSSLIHNRRFFYIQDYLIHYFDAFNPSFLFSHGDVNPRLSIQETGELYYLDLIFILAGIYFLFSKKQQYRWLIIGWLIVSPLGPATARETPHALRMIHILPTFQLISAFGLVCLFQKIKYKKLFIAAITIIMSLNFFYYLHMYYFHWPLNYSDQWQYGYKQAVETVKPLYSQYDHVLVSKDLGRPYIYFLLYNRQDPSTYLKTAKIEKDKYYFIEVKGYDKYLFVDSFDNTETSGKTLYVATVNQLPSYTTKIKTINNLSGATVFEIGEASR